MAKLLPLPELPVIELDSPELTKVLDKIRFELWNREEMSEFFWFAREYPRYYRYHLYHVKHRLKSIHGIYAKYHKEYRRERMKLNCFSSSRSDIDCYLLYWEFETFLSAVNIALDTLARIIGTCYKEQAPLSFNKLCGWKEAQGPVLLLRDAKIKWVQKLKNYRDCFTHYTPVDSMPQIGIVRTGDQFLLRAKLPLNPNARENLRFKFRRKVDVLRYALSVYKNLLRLDKQVAKEIAKLYDKQMYPIRTDNLFFVGARSEK
jgi:hypothetical protein